MAFSKKFFIVFLFVILFFIICLSNNCYATYTIERNGNTFLLNDIDTINFSPYPNYNSSCDYFITYETRVNKFLLAVLPINNTQKVYRFSYNGSGFICWDNTTKFLLFFYNLSNAQWEYTANQHYYDHIDGFYLSTINIYNGKTDNIYYAKDYYAGPAYVQPSFVSTKSELDDFSNVSTLNINAGDFEDTIYLKLYNSSTNTLLFQTKLTNYEDYIEREDLENPFSDLIYKIPIDKLPSFTLNNTDTFDFTLTYYNENDVLSNVSIFFNPNVNGIFNSVSNNEINNNIDQTNDKIDQTNEKLDQTNQELSDINDNITDSNVDDIGANDLPSVSVNDPTEDDIGNIFNEIYNAFCVGNAQDIVFPIPFTNKNISLSATYIQDMLTNNNAQWVLTFIQAFWAYLFGRFIIKDMSKKINKIKSGDIENLQSDNIKEEML